MIAALTGLDTAQYIIQEFLREKPADAAALVIGSVEIHLPLAGMVDLAEEKSGLEKELRSPIAYRTTWKNFSPVILPTRPLPPWCKRNRDKLAGYKENSEKNPGAS